MTVSKVMRLVAIAALSYYASPAQTQVSRLETVSYSDSATMGLQALSPSDIGNGSEHNDSVSSDGRFAVFKSFSGNLVPFDTNGVSDIFVHDLRGGVTSRVSVSSAGAQANALSNHASISADGRFVAFASAASNLVTNDTNGASDIFVHDRLLSTTSRVSVTSAGQQGNGQSSDPVLSADGSTVAFASESTNMSPLDINGTRDVYLHHRPTAKTTLISATSTGNAGNNESHAPAISANGGTITFMSASSDLVSGDANGLNDIFLTTNPGSVKRISVSSAGVEANESSFAPDISDDGNIVAFYSRASNLVPGDGNNSDDIFTKNVASGATSIVSTSATGVYANSGSGEPAISGDGSMVSFLSGATNLVVSDPTSFWPDIYRKTLGSGLIQIVSVNSANTPAFLGNGFSSLSANGGVVIFESAAADLVPGDTNGVMDVFSRDIGTGITRRISIPSDAGSNALSSVSEGCCARQLSGDGRYAVFTSSASNLVPGDTNGTTDVFVHDRDQGQTRRVSVSTSGVQSNGVSSSPTISRDGRYVAFRSLGTNLISGGTNAVNHIFVHDLQTVQTAIVSISSLGVHSTAASGVPTISANGRYVAFDTIDDLISGTGWGISQIYLRDIQTGLTTIESKNTGGQIGANTSSAPSISEDGNFIVFASRADNLVLGDSNQKWDIFRRDRQYGITLKVSINGSVQGNMDSRYPSISDNGEIIAFETASTNLNGGLGDGNSVSDIYVRSMGLSSLKRASTGTGGSEANGASTSAAISGNGRFVAYNSVATNLVTGDTNALGDVFVTDVLAASPITGRLSVDALGNQGTGASLGASLSTDGGSALFGSTTESAWIIDAGQNGLFKDVFWISRLILP